MRAELRCPAARCTFKIVLADTGAACTSIDWQADVEQAARVDMIDHLVRVEGYNPVIAPTAHTVAGSLGVSTVDARDCYYRGSGRGKCAAAGPRFKIADRPVCAKHLPHLVDAAHTLDVPALVEAWNP